MREAAGGETTEDVWHRLNNLEQVLFLGIKASFSNPIRVDTLLEYARSAWAAMRFEVPIIALSTTTDAAGRSIMTYRVPKGVEGVRAWAGRTIRLVDRAPDLDDYRFSIALMPIPDEHGDQTFIHIIHRSDTEYDFLLHTSHVPFDGSGIKIVMREFFERLARKISDPSSVSEHRCQWGTETSNLLPAVTEVLGPDEPRSGEKYDQTLKCS